jgi:hypothetical protein
MGLHRGIDDLGEFTAAKDADALGTEFGGQAGEQLFTREKKAILLGESRRGDSGRHSRESCRSGDLWHGRRSDFRPARSSGLRRGCFRIVGNNRRD